jgi:hypothetical protein
LVARVGGGILSDVIERIVRIAGSFEEANRFDGRAPA